MKLARCQFEPAQIIKYDICNRCREHHAWWLALLGSFVLIGCASELSGTSNSLPEDLQVELRKTSVVGTSQKRA